MCRFIAYLGEPTTINDILVKTEHSLLSQSQRALETQYVVNGDGFGLGWYSLYPDLVKNHAPALFRSIHPAWNDQNLLHLARSTATSYFFAHVRAATAGNVSQDNCHPFNYKNMLFMHNGHIGQFDKIKRLLRRQLSDESYAWIRGQTDSEHFFALMLDYLKHDTHPTVEQAIKAIESSIKDLKKLMKQESIEDLIHINAVFGYGEWLLAIRYTSDTKQRAATLYYAKGKKMLLNDDTYRFYDNDKPAMAVIASERLDTQSDWHEVPENYYLMIHKDLTIKERALQC